MASAKKARSATSPVDAIIAEPTGAKVPTKSAPVLILLRLDDGATLAELVTATGWQPHATRAMLTGLRKKGHAIERRKRNGVSCYHLPTADA